MVKGDSLDGFKVGISQPKLQEIENFISSASFLKFGWPFPTLENI
jgi:hypothetical protein